MDFYFDEKNGILKNILNITNLEELDKYESIIVQKKAIIIFTKIKGKRIAFNLLKAIHKELFKEIYEWAGKPREINIKKVKFDGNLSSAYIEFDKIEEKAKEIFKQLNAKPLKFFSKEVQIKKLAHFYNDINSIHTFRDGNTRTQIILTTELARQNGIELDFSLITYEDFSSVVTQAKDEDNPFLLENIFKSIYIKSNKLDKENDR